MPRKKNKKSRPGFERNLQASAQMRAAWRLVRSGKAPDVGTALRMISTEARLVANPGMRAAYRAKHSALRKSAKGTRAIDPMDLGLEAAYRLGARPVEMSPMELLQEAAHARAYGKKSTARSRAGRYLDEARQLGPLNLPNPLPPRTILWHQFTPGPTALDSWISDLEVRFPVSAHLLSMVRAEVGHAQTKLDRGDTAAAGKSLIVAATRLREVTTLHKLAQRKYEAALRLADQMEALGKRLVAVAPRANPRALTDARSGARTKITAKKVAGGYGYTVKNIYSPVSRTVESFGSGREVYHSAAAALAAAREEIAREGYRKL